MDFGEDQHRHLLTLDAHLDTPVHFARAGWRFGDRHDLLEDVAQVDLPRMEDGNLSGGFFVIYVEQGALGPAAYAEALSRARLISDRIDAVLAHYPDRIGLARTSADAHRLHESGRRIAFKSVENSTWVGEDLSLVAEFHERGVRLAGPVHSRSNQLADSATDDPIWHGLSPLGRRWTAEMNRLGIVIDASHASDAAFDQMLDLSTAPLLLSHSGSRTMYDTPRNLDDGRLRALAEQGGVIGFATIFLSAMQLGENRKELFRLHGRIEQLDPEAQRSLAREWNALDAAEPMWEATFERYMAALFHVIEIVGTAHVCFGADWDGGGGFPGMADITVLPRITEALLAKGFSHQDVSKLWSGNLLRLLDAVQGRASSLP